ncbi:MAG: pilus assembly protein [Gammaproteobacteria bacterium]|nr:pilus assembly protein [Gammaproteobacteria bacterium]
MSQKSMSQIRPLPKQQKGVALFISLVLLLILTIIGVSSVQTTSLEVRMTRNEHDSMLAFQSAESALRDAEAQLELITSTAGFTDAGNNGLYDSAEMGDAENWLDANVWSGTNSVVAATAVSGVFAAPRYVIEWVASVDRADLTGEFQQTYGSSGADVVEIFRITAQGVGGTANARVLLQSSYGRVMD